MISKNNSKLEVAFIGGAINSAVGSAHFSALNIDNKFKVVAGYFSRDRTTNHLTGKDYGVNDNRIYDNLSSLITKEKDKIDLIIILTPTDQHCQQVLECIKAGIPVVCEKALANNSFEAVQIQDELLRNKAFLAVIYNYLGYPMLRELRNIIELGNLGKLRHIQIEMPQEGFKRILSGGAPVIPQSWRLHDGIIPTISLDLGVHLHMIIKYLTGEIPLNVVSRSNKFGNFPDIVDNVSCIIEYSKDLICNMWFSKIAIGKRNGLNLRVFGEFAAAEWIQEFPEYLNMADNRGHRWSIDRGSIEVEICNQKRYTRFKAGHPAGFIEAYANYYYDIALSLDQYHENKVNYLNSNCFGMKESLEGLCFLEAIAKSSVSKSSEMVEQKS